MSLLSVEHVSRTYHAGDAAVAAVCDVSLEIARGEFVAIVGPSGCGKSTLLHVCGAMERPSAGRIWLDGSRLDTLADDGLTRVRRERLGFVFQFFNLLPTLSLVENIALPLLLAGGARDTSLARARRWATELGLAHRLDHRPAQLSGGEMQRAAIARAVVHDPALVLADEPTGNLDSANGARILDALVRLNRDRGLTLLLATHAADVAAAADRVVHMRDGQNRSHRRPAATGGGHLVALFGWFILRRIAQERVRTGLTVAGIALGVAVVLAIRLANASALGGFAAALDTVAGKTSLEVIGTGLGVDEPRLAQLTWLRTWGDVSPVIEGDALAVLSPNRTEAVRVLGVDVLRDQPIREYRLDVGAGDRQPTTQAFLGLLLDPTSVVITEVFARRHGLVAEPPDGPDAGGRSTLHLAMGDQVREFRIRALLRNQGPARALDGNFVLMDIAAAQWAFDRLGRVDRVDVRLAEPSRLDEAERAIGARLPAGLHVQRPARRGQQVEQMLAAFQFNLAALSYVALLVGLFLVYNTVATSVIARRDEIGMLRALGTPHATVLVLFLGEAAALAALGCLAGIPLGWGLARGAVAFTSATVTTLYAAHAAGVPALTWTDAALAVGLGLPLALIAAAAPALEAARVSPLRAVRGGTNETEESSTRWRWTAGGAACLLASAACSQAGPIRGLPIFGFLSAVLIVFGLAALVPAVLTGLARVTGGPTLGWLGIEGRLAHANLTGAIRRLSVSVAALAVSLAMLVAIAVMIGSFRETVIYWVAQTLRADLYVATARRSNLDAQATISASLEQAIAGDPDVDDVDRFRALSVTFRDRLIVLGSGDFRVLLDHGALVFKAPADGPGALASAIGRDAIVVSESLSLRFGVHVGDRIDVPTPAGPRPFHVAAVYYDYSTDRGVVVLDRATFLRHFGDQRPTSLSVYLRPGADAGAVRARLMAQLAPTHRLFIHTNTTLRSEVLRIFDATFAITYGLEAIAIVVAVLGVTGTLVTLILERRRDLATLRLVGADLRQIRRMIVIEAGMLGAVSQALGMAAGLALSVVLIYVINVQSFGWTIQFHIPTAFLVQAMGLVLAATTLAGVYPARLAAGFRPADEISTE